MPDQDSGNRSAGERAKQQLRDLGRVVRQTARDLDKSYPNTDRGNQIIRQYQHQTNKIVQRGRQAGNRSLPSGYSRPSSAAANDSLVLVKLLLLVLLGVVGFVVWAVGWPLAVVLPLFFLCVWVLTRSKAITACSLLIVLSYLLMLLLFP